jgi:hypothetical protein
MSEITLERTKLFDTIALSYPNFYSFSNKDKIVFLLSNINTAPLTASFLFETYSRRSI